MSKHERTNLDLILALAWNNCGPTATEADLLAFCTETAKRLGMTGGESMWLDALDDERWVKITNLIAESE